MIGYLLRRKIITPAFGRFLESTAYVLATYALGAMAEGKMVSAYGAAAALLASPVFQGAAKAYRDKFSK